MTENSKIYTPHWINVVATDNFFADSNILWPIVTNISNYVFSWNVLQKEQIASIRIEKNINNKSMNSLENGGV